MSKPARALALSLSLSLALGLAASCHRERFEAVVHSGDEVVLVRAIKGHELVVQKGAERARLRLVGIYTLDPKGRRQRETTVYAKRAVQVIEGYTGRPLRVTLEREQPDNRGRYLAFVDADGVDLARHLVDEGLAALYTEFPFSRERDYFAAEAVARANVRGLWGGPAARARVGALRETWGAVRRREQGAAADDPLTAGRAR